ncbi:hypothetical protein ACFOZ7_06165 [Natribaculum luteum]|uniref:DUF7344 domain-containing protein n=1 Tax=Natribaculum luteum TaxID=1586232 RepID=A0ABD5NX25_9EURY|nr:hypothetical protein [Natribaculum luteum]
MKFSRAENSVRSTDRSTELFETLSSPRRRTILAVLEAGDASSVSELVTCLLAERGLDEDASALRRRAAVSLVHVHLPWLDDRGLVDWDCETGTVALTAAARVCDLEAIERIASTGAAAGEIPTDASTGEHP